MTRAFRQQADDQILDRAAALFAQHGFAHTSVQAVADAVGLSKAGLLHHFPSKDALHAAVLAQSTALGQQVVDLVEGLPLGPERDRRAVEALTDVALAHPGLIALMLGPVTQGGDDGLDEGPTGAGEAALRAFGVDPATADPERVVRVVGALAAIAVLSLAAARHSQTTQWRPFVVATCTDALGHRRLSTGTSSTGTSSTGTSSTGTSSTGTSSSDQVEA
ncbi:TetR/AcrR family transcriptional regulator [Modestobacter muralis]|uniref:TetR/AcrR family transcriptional regulator n=1 Tax=Modestobacter muralis TaxID=1608614 RepID=A0A6P0HB49_9ACTN|nr:TetR/AcrR family transcriptional regulator [Modestobacter muralis]NEN52383.1 TetR/AcrR family transcriptional regulator [Modestobacter muralis]